MSGSSYPGNTRAGGGRLVSSTTAPYQALRVSTNNLLYTYHELARRGNRKVCLTGDDLISFKGIRGSLLEKNVGFV